MLYMHTYSIHALYIRYMYVIHAHVQYTCIELLGLNDMPAEFSAPFPRL